MATKKIKPVATRNVFHSNQDGKTVTREAEVFLDSDCKFFIQLPSYMHYQDGDVLRTTVNAAALTDCVIDYEKASEDYSRRILTRDSGKRVLWMGAILAAPNFTAEAFGVQSLLALGVQPVRQLPDGSMVDEDGVIVGVSGMERIILPDSPEVREKIARLAKSIDTAAEIIGGIRTAADPVAYLLSIPESTVDASGQASGCVTDPKQIELSLEVASDDNPAPNPPVEDDEEL